MSSSHSDSLRVTPRSPSSVGLTVHDGSMRSLPEVPALLAQRLSEPPTAQRAFAWKIEKWIPVVHDLPDAEAVLRELPQRLDRQTVREVVQTSLSQEQALGAFIAVYIWGGAGGYNPGRARAVLTGNRTRENLRAPIDPDVEAKLLEGALRVRRSGAEEAFRYMNNDGKVKYLGGAYFTKWMSFSSMISDMDGPEVAPILDKRVRDWIFSASQGNSAVSLTTRLTRDYRLYLDLLEAWGKPFDRSRAQVELAIFELTRSKATSVSR